MAARKQASAKKSARKQKAGRAKPGAARKRLTPARLERGLDGDEVKLDITSAEVAPLADEVTAVGGAALGAYREPLSGRPMLLASLPIESVRPTPFQRDLSPTHTRRLAQKIEESGSFLDPLIVVRGVKGETRPPMPMGAALTRMAASARKLDVDKVREGDVALVAAASGGSE